MKINTVLLPLDGSPLAEAALPYAEAIATATGARLRLVTVIEREPALTAGSVRAHLEERHRQTLDAYLTTTARALRDRGFAVTTALLHGTPVDEILFAADEADVDLIVISTHGRGGLDRWLLGSVADKVLRLGTKPVLVVPPAPEPETRKDVALRRVLVPLDGSALAEGVIGEAVQIARGTGAILVLARVEPWLATSAAFFGYLPNVDRMDAEAEEAARAYLTEARGRIPQEIGVETVVLRGAPALELVKYALDERIDLVLMTSHGRGGVRRFVLGSTADRIIRSGVPALIVCPHPAESAVDDGVASAATQRR